MSLNGEQIILKKADSLDWCLCVFFSVDLEGATRYKTEVRLRQYSEDRETDEDWCSIFQNFYIEFPYLFRQAYTPLCDYPETRNIKQPIMPVLWKFVGDEILLYSPLIDSCQILEHLRAFVQTISNYNEVLKEMSVDVRCKGTAWIAGFPLNNRIVKIAIDGEKPMIDFIGSSIDTGFRLTRYATQQRIVVSLDLLWLLLESRNKYNTVQKYNFDIRFHGEYVLKGVLNEAAYPVFWLNWKQEDEDSWKIPPRIQEVRKTLEFCQSFSQKCHKDSFVRPFIEDDLSALFAEIPESFIRNRDLLKQYLNEAKTTTTVDEIVPEKDLDVSSTQNMRRLKQLEV